MHHRDHGPAKCRYNVKIDGTKYYFDVAKQELRQVNKPDHKIKFDDMSYDDELYYLFYDTKKKTIYKGGIDAPKLPDHVKLVVFALETIEGKLPPVTVRFVPLKEQRADLKKEGKQYLQTTVSRNHRKRHRL